MNPKLGDLNKVWEIKALKNKDKQDEAKNILDRIAKQVEPIMRKHNWRVKLLSEFWYITPSSYACFSFFCTCTLYSVVIILLFPLFL